MESVADLQSAVGQTAEPRRTASNVGKTRKGATKAGVSRSGSSLGHKVVESAQAEAKQERSRGKIKAVTMNPGVPKEREAKETLSLSPTSNNGKQTATPERRRSASVGRRVQEALNTEERPTPSYGPHSASEELDSYIAGQQTDEAAPLVEATEGEPLVRGAQDNEFPTWLSDALAERGFQSSDFASPAAAHKFLAAGLQNRQTQTAHQAQQAEEQKVFELFEGLDREAFESEFGDHGKKLLSVIERAHKRDQETIQRLTQHAQASQQAITQQYFDAVDSAFDSLNREFGNAFGAGGRDDLSPHSLEMSNRETVYRMARVMEQDLANQGRQVPNMRTLLKRAAQATMGNRRKSEAVAEEASEKPAKPRPKVAGGAATNGHDTLSPRAGALQQIRQYMRH